MNTDKPIETVRFTCERCGAPAWWRTRLCDNCFARQTGAGRNRG